MDFGQLWLMIPNTVRRCLTCLLGFPCAGRLPCKMCHTRGHVKKTPQIGKPLRSEGCLCTRGCRVGQIIMMYLATPAHDNTNRCRQAATLRAHCRSEQNSRNPSIKAHYAHQCPLALDGHVCTRGPSTPVPCGYDYTHTHALRTCTA